MGRPIARASVSLSFSTWFFWASRRCCSVCRCTSARSTSIPATVPACFWIRRADRRECLRGVELCLDRFHARSIRDHGQIGVAHRLYDQIARILSAQFRGLLTFGSGLQVLQRSAVVDRLLRKGPDILVPERARLIFGIPGRLKPNAARSICCDVCVAPTERFGSNVLSVLRRSAFAVSAISPLVRIPRLYRRPR